MACALWRNGSCENKMVSLECFNFQEFGDYLLKEGVHEDVVSAIVNNGICSETFLDLTENDLKELALTIGDRIRLRNITEEGQKVSLFV